MLGANLKGLLRGGGGLICVGDASAAGPILHPRVQTACGGLMFAVNFVLVPGKPALLSAQFFDFVA